MKDLSNEELIQGINLILDSDSFNNELARGTLKKGISELIASGEEAANLKCCGNCFNHYAKEPCRKMFDFGYCNDWKSDGLTREDRTKE